MFQHVVKNFSISSSGISGSNHIYVFKNPKNPTAAEGTPSSIDWEFAQKELAQAKGFTSIGASGLSKGNNTDNENQFNSSCKVNFFSKELRTCKNKKTLTLKQSKCTIQKERN